MGTELLARGVPTPLPLWSAQALRDAPDVVREIHASYAAVGATIHTTNTFRTKPGLPQVPGPDDWESLTRLAVRLATEAGGDGGRVAGSIAPLADCYRPDLSPPEPFDPHRAFARVLADAGCDLLLCETFPHIGEAEAAVRAAVETGVETWAALTAGPEASLLTPDAMAEGARRLVAHGCSAILVNCTPAVDTLPYVEALVSAVDVPVGAYANAGSVDDEVGWKAPQSQRLNAGVLRYVELAERWVDAGAQILGACCGTGPDHVAALAQRFTPQFTRGES